MTAPGRTQPIHQPEPSDRSQPEAAVGGIVLAGSFWPVTVSQQTNATGLNRCQAVIGFVIG